MSELTLERNGVTPPAGPLVIVVMDGVGVGAGDEGDAVHLARTPVLDGLWARHPTTRLAAHGTAVGLPSDADMGNSEVGHNALGAGRVVDQGAKLVDRAIAGGTLFEGPVWREMVAACQPGGGTLHFLGLLSDGNVHSHIDQLLALLRRAAADGVPRVRVHILLDGRDVPGDSALIYVDRLEAALAEINAGGRDYRVASGGGRMRITMDRYEADWAMVARGWRVHVHGEGRRFPSAREAIETLRREDPAADDQNLPPFVVADEGGPVGPIEDGDAVVFFNFRGDRAIEISRAFEEEAFDAFDRGRRPRVIFAGMMQYDGDLGIPKKYLVAPPVLDRTMGEYLARSGVPQLACAETQKFGHVTYFWNGNRSGAFDPRRETYIEVPSDNVPFDQRPWMKAAEVTDAVVEALRARPAGQARVNYANGDMVGHTGDLRAAILAVEAVDLCLGRLVPAVLALGGVLLLTADHGNSDQMCERGKEGGCRRDAAGAMVPRTSHSLNPVPFTIVDGRERPGYALDPGVARPGLSNVAATALWLMGYRPPDHFDPPLVRPAG